MQWKWRLTPLPCAASLLSEQPRINILYLLVLKGTLWCSVEASINFLIKFVFICRSDVRITISVFQNLIRSECVVGGHKSSLSSGDNSLLSS